LADPNPMPVTEVVASANYEELSGQHLFQYQERLKGRIVGTGDGCTRRYHMQHNMDAVLVS